MTPIELTEAFGLYLQHPLDDGTAVLHLAGEPACLEVGPVPDSAALPLRVAELVPSLRTDAVVLAVARRGRRPRPADLLLWTELCAALSGTGTALLPLELLPAAA